MLDAGAHLVDELTALEMVEILVVVCGVTKSPPASTHDERASLYDLPLVATFITR